MIKKVMSYLNIGSPHVDLVLNNMELNPGESVTGTFYVEGGWARQHIKRLECDLVKEFQGDTVETVDAVTTILMSKSMDANDKAEYPFCYQLPIPLEPSTEHISYRFHTRLIFQDDVKSMDHDEIVVLELERIKA
ncbi:MAG: sporulation protein [Bacillota bacterium]|uniref:sporulation protein n=1 Tax=Bacillus sp. RO2 TaxID=2723913 RepID=UPI00145D674D|nr:sporulation protein [Bacillus sp. RO2]MEA3319627.1 sporulation protein [Bacillota bacterium]NMH72016.1 sporulation protein [Bacillus sp. RO2]